MKHINFFLILSAFFIISCNRTHDNRGTEPSVAETIDESTDIGGEAAENELTVSDDSLSLDEYMSHSKHNDEYEEGILVRMAKDAPDYVEKILTSEFDKFIVVDKARMMVILYDRYGNEIKKYGMACAKNYGTKHKKGDARTPEGFFTVEGVYDSTDWLFTDDDGKTSPKKGQFGPRFIRINCPMTSQIGIHGTCAPWSIGHRTSHGCIRLTNENILELVEYVEPGMPVIISPGRKDAEVNEREGVFIEKISTDGTNETVRPGKAEEVNKDSITDRAVETNLEDTIVVEKERKLDVVEN